MKREGIYLSYNGNRYIRAAEKRFLVGHNPVNITPYWIYVEILDDEFNAYLEQAYREMK